MHWSGLVLVLASNLQEDNRLMILLLGQNVYRWKQTILIVKRYGLILIPDPVYLAIHKIEIYKHVVKRCKKLN